MSVLVFHTNAIVGYHSGWRGAVLDQKFGVTVFFVVSGFLLYRPFVAARLGHARPLRIGGYAKRRVLRILPAYLLAVTVLAIYPGLPGVFGPHWWVYYGFAQDYSANTVFKGLAPAWTLGTEVVFYALLPLYALALGLPWLNRSRRAVIRAEAVVLGSLAVLAVVFGHSFGASSSYLSRTVVGTFDWFALGMGLAVASAVLAGTAARLRLVSFVVRRPSLCWLAAAAIWAVSAGLARTHPHNPRYDLYSGRLFHLLYGLIALFIVLPAVFGDDQGGLPRRILRARPVVWIGLVSYGIFLWHFPIIIKLSQIGSGSLGVGAWTLGPTVLLGLACAAVTIACAALSYYALERPALLLKERRLGLPSLPGRARAARTLSR
jgi:peptidoglycan/LPS O-acetylase OafA/YrhL